jgi:metallo-beta-lactamase family protein
MTPGDLFLNFFGAAQNVTGSCYLLEARGTRLLVDCGIYQERDLKKRNWDPFPLPPHTIDCVLLTHAHLDHCGRLPKLVQQGFKGPIYCTPATADIARIVMLDAAKIQEEDAAFKKKRHEREGRKSDFPETPLYTIKDVEATLPLLTTFEYDRPFQAGSGVEVFFQDAGHILGSSSVHVRAGLNGESRTVVFSGDVGRWDAPILRNPVPVAEADYVLVESTYGDREHKDPATIPETLARVVNETARAGGNIVIPTFAVERSQDLLYHLNLLRTAGRIPPLRVFMDSPMAVNVTQVFRKHPELFDEETRDLLHRGIHPCDFQGLSMCRTAEESKAIRDQPGASIILAGAGMCTAGRIKHHLVNNITRPECTVLFVGYQAVGTLGRQILEGAKDVRILGQTHPVRARVAKVNGFSAHGDRQELLRWLAGMKKPPRQVFATHGEPSVAAAFAQFVAAKTGWKVTVPVYEKGALLS